MTADPFATPGDKIPSYDRPRGDAEDRAAVPRDQWDRYLIPHLDGSKPAANKGFTRVSTLKAAVVDKRGINRNNIGLVAAGIATVPALAKAAAEAERDGDKKALRAVADRAIVAAGGKDRAALGTTVHDATERINRGESDVHVPTEYRPDVDAYYQLLHENNVRVLPEFMERVVLCPYNTAGTFDNIVQWFNPDLGEIDEDTSKPTGEWEWLVADLKTGRTLEDAKLEIMIQLWLYANAYGVLDLDTMTYSPLPVEVRQDRAMIIHVPMAGGVAELFVVDISGAERYVRAAVEIRRGNREAEGHWRSTGKVSPPAFVAPPMDVAGHSTGAELTAKEAGYAQATPQQVADAETAERRMAQVVGPLASATPEQITEAVQRSIAETVGLKPSVDTAVPTAGQQIASAILDGEGKPLAPMAGPGKRGCSKCGRTGHRSTSKRCLGDADPAKAVVDSDGASNAFMAELPPADGGPVTSPPIVGEQGPEPFATAQPATVIFTIPGERTPESTIPHNVGRQPSLWCIDPSHRSEGWTAQGDQWVCPVDGLPSEEGYRRTQVDSIAAEIDACTHPEQVLNLRTSYLALNRWSPTYDEQARLKHHSLSWPTPLINRRGSSLP